MNIKQINAIENFLGSWSGNTLLSPFLNAIANNCFEEDDVKFLFCNEKKERDFWGEQIENYKQIEKYIHIYVYSNLYEWSFSNSVAIKKRCEDFWESNADDIQKEYEDFINNLNLIPVSVHSRLGVVMDSNFWREKLETPYLSKLSAQPEVPNWFKPDIVCEYQKILLDKARIGQQNFIDNIDRYLQFCLILDTHSDEKTNFIEMLKTRCGKESIGLEDILDPYYGDDFGLALLHYCENNRKMYSLSEETVSQYKSHLCYNSWFRKITEKLGEHGKPYSVELCENTSSHKEIVRYLNERHRSFWNKCNYKNYCVKYDVQRKNPKLKREAVRDGVIKEFKLLYTREKELIISKVTTLVKNALCEGIKKYIEILHTSAIENSNGLELTDDVSNLLYRKLVEKYINFDLIDFPNDMVINYNSFGDKVARVWVRRYFLDDEISEQIDKDKITEITQNFDTLIWEPIQKGTIEWCKRNYGYMGATCIADYSEMPSYNDSSYDDDWKGIYDAHIGGL